MSSPLLSSSHPLPPHFDVPAILSPAEITVALRDLATAVQEIHLYLADPYGPPLAAPPAATTGPLLLSWQPPHLAVSTAVAATTPPWLPWPSQPLAGPIVAVASLQQPAPSPPWLTWPSQPLAGPVAVVDLLQQPALPPLSPGPATTVPAGVPIQQVRFPPSPSPLSSWIATRHVSAAVRL
nr:classical arabinogalactan protein 9-like [Lolium perenne]